MRLVVTGATGNVGTAVLRRLATVPEVDEIVGVVRRVPAAGAGTPYDGVRWVACDVGERAAVDTLTDAARGAAAVIHLAWQIRPTRSPDRLWRTNVLGSAHVIEATLNAGVPALVVASSVGAYARGPKDQAVDETWSTAGVPGSGYSQHKAAVEATLNLISRDHMTLRVVRLRPGLIFQPDAGSEPWAPVRLLRFGRLPVVPNHPRLRVQGVHADDVADAYVRAALSDVSGAFNIAADPVLDGPTLARLFGGRTVPVHPVLLRMAAALTWRLRLQPIDAGWVRLAEAVPLLDTTRARRELGWQPRHRADEALCELVAGAGRATAPLRPRLGAAARPR